MLEIGKYNELRACRATSSGMYLRDDESGEEVLLPGSEEPEDLLNDDILNVFIYKDSEDRLIATTRQPKVVRDHFAYLRVAESTSVGAFLDWGLPKDLLVPFAEQHRKMVQDSWHLVYVFLDEETDRLVASSKIYKFLDRQDIDLQPGDAVDLLIANESDLGRNVIINHRYSGLIFHNDLVRPVRTGEAVKGFVKTIKPGNKIDVSLQAPGYKKVAPSADKILQRLRAGQGFLDLTDKSDPARIQKELSMSKKTFKKAIGALYKQRLIRIETDGIYLVEE